MQQRDKSHLQQVTRLITVLSDLVHLVYPVQARLTCSHVFPSVVM